MRILVVDDDPVILDLVSMVLRTDYDEDVSVMSSAQGALEILNRKDERFDVLILDIDMPEMNGIELCTKVRALPAYRATPIIMLTARTDMSSIESAFAAGATDYITKPFDLKGIHLRLQVAERMMRESCDIFTQDSLLNPVPAALDGKEVSSEGPLRIVGLPQHSDYFSLGNYLAQLERKRVDESVVFAVQINDFDKLCDTLSTREMLTVISEVSNGICAAAQDPRLLNAFIGSGVFMCIASKNMLDFWLEVEQRIEDYLRASERMKSMGFDFDVSVIVGRPFRPSANRTQRVRQTFDRARTQLEKRAQSDKKAL